ncbi:unnamed protein product [Boreogadus saida]
MAEGKGWQFYNVTVRINILEADPGLYTSRHEESGPYGYRPADPGLYIYADPPSTHILQSELSFHSAAVQPSA